MIFFSCCSDTGITRDNPSWDQKHTDTCWLTFIVIYMIKYHCVVYSARAFCSLTHSDFSFHSSKRTEFTDYISFYFSYSNQSAISSSVSCYTKCATINMSYETDLIRMSHVLKKQLKRNATDPFIAEQDGICLIVPRETVGCVIAHGELAGSF